MIKKLEQYLLVNYPTLWNIKIIPVGLLISVLYVVFFLAGFLLITPEIKDNAFDDNGLFYIVFAGSILAAILIFIFWLLQYRKQNSIKAFYPRSNASVYAEWLCLLVICIIICMLPITMIQGRDTKWKITVPEKEYREVRRILERIEVLMPTDAYRFEFDPNYQPLSVGDADVDRTHFDTKLFTYEEDAEKPDNPIEYVGPSLLYFNTWVDKPTEADERETVKNWLRMEQKDSIRATIEAFMLLQKKHKLKTSIDTDTWMKLVYNPPLYPVTEYNQISTTSDYIYGHQRYYTQYYDLKQYYEQANKSYWESDSVYWTFMIPVIIGLGLSIMIFSARMTSGRSWIFALLCWGILLFIYGLFMAFTSLISPYSSSFLLSLFWFVIFIVIGSMIAMKIMNKQNKSNSAIYVNLFVWYIPALIPIVYTLYLSFRVMLLREDDLFTGDSDEDITLYNICLAELIFTVIAMYPVSILLKKWRALPEA